MSTIVHLALRGTDLHSTPQDRERAEQPLPVDLDRLTPRARALAETLAATPVKAPVAVMLESARTVREMDPDADPLWHTPEQLDAPHRVTWSAWSHYPVESGMDPHEYLERQARKLPLGYFPIGRDSFTSVPSADAARDDTDLIAKGQVIALLRELGRPVTAASVDNYRSSPPAGWPQPVRYVGRTPMWSSTQIQRYALADRKDQ